ncbi:hypothetical protein NOS3756_44310 [Nostoc sp. NIES-3756]|nr:hypothetical protein NOS3756_44310 [Nostoc sp. NIES-3756]
MMAACTSFSSMAGLPQLIALPVKLLSLTTPCSIGLPDFTEISSILVYKKSKEMLKLKPEVGCLGDRQALHFSRRISLSKVPEELLTSAKVGRLNQLTVDSYQLSGCFHSDFSRHLEDLSPNLPPARREALISPPSLQRLRCTHKSDQVASQRFDPP